MHSAVLHVFGSAACTIGVAWLCNASMQLYANRILYESGTAVKGRIIRKFQQTSLLLCATNNCTLQHHFFTVEFPFHLVTARVRFKVSKKMFAAYTNDSSIDIVSCYKDGYMYHNIKERLECERNSFHLFSQILFALFMMSTYSLAYYLSVASYGSMTFSILAAAIVFVSACLPHEYHCDHRSKQNAIPFAESDDVEAAIPETNNDDTDSEESISMGSAESNLHQFVDDDGTVEHIPEPNNKTEAKNSTEQDKPQEAFSILYESYIQAPAPQADAKKEIDYEDFVMVFK